MKTIRSRSLAIVIGMLFCWPLPSYICASVQIDGIYYELYTSTKTAAVASSPDGYTGAIVIPSSFVSNGDTYSVKSIGSSAFSHCTGLTSVTIPSSVTSISSLAFYECTGLTSVTIPSNVTSIGSDAFSGCSGLTSFKVSSSNIKYDSRNNCNAIIETSTNTLVAGCKNTIIPNGVTSIGNGAFAACTGLTSIKIPNSVTSIGSSAFYYCTGLTSVTIPGNVTSIGSQAFYYCTGLTWITVDNPTPIGIDLYSETFSGVDKSNCILYVPKDSKVAYERAEVWNEFSIEERWVISTGSCSDFGDVSYTVYSDMTMVISGRGYMYLQEESPICNNYQSIKKVIIEEGVTSICSVAFSGCTSLTSVTIPSSVNSIGDYAFSGCSGLTSVTIPSGVTSIRSQVFSGCSGLSSIQVSSSNTKYDSRNNCNAIIETSTNKLIAGCKNSIIPSGVTSISLGAFSDCTGLTSVTIPSSVTSIGPLAFSGCSGLTSLTILSGVTSIQSSAFSGCSGLTSVTIPNSVTSIERSAFSDCPGLTSIQVSSSNTKYDSRNNCNAIIETSTNTIIAGCKNSIIPSSVTSIGYQAFSGCADLSSVTIPSSVTTIDYHAFYNCTGLTSVTIPSNVTSIGSEAFSGCSGLTSIQVSPSNTKYDSRNNCNAIIETSSKTLLFGCINTIIPSGVTSIKDGAFYNCTGLTSVTIPSSVYSIRRAFYGCTGLTSIIVENANPIEIFWSDEDVEDEFVFSDVNFSACTLYVPAGSRSAYQSEEGWSRFRIREYVPAAQVDGICYNLNMTEKTAEVVAGEERYFGNVTIPSSFECYGSTFSVTTIGEEAFLECFDLTSMVIPSSVKNIGEGAFSGCTNLTSITCECDIPVELTSGVFLNVDKSNCYLYVPAGSKSAYENAEGWSEFQNIVEYTPALEVLATGSCGDNVTYTIYSDMTMVISGTGEMWDYSYNTHINNDYYQSIKNVIIEDGVTHIGKYAFYGCTGLTTITIPNSVTSVGEGAFGGTAWFDNQPDGLIYINDIAYKYKGEMPEGSSITLRNGTISIAAYAFSGHSGLTSIMIPNSVTSIGEYAFMGCTRLASVTFPNSLFIIGYNAFEETAWLDNQPEGLVYAGNVVYSYKGEDGYGISKDLIVNEGTLGIMPEVFFRDDRYNDQDDRVVSIASVSFPSTLVYLQPLLSYIPSGDVFFRKSCILSSLNVEAITVDANNPVYDSRDNCNAIIETSTNKLIVGSKSTVIPIGVTTIGAYTLGQLTSVTIPSSVNLIEDCAFCPEYYHRELKEDHINTDDEDLLELLGDWYVSSPIETIRMEGLIPPSAAFTSVNTSTCILYVPSGSKSAYENADGWREFVNIVEYEPYTDISTLDNAIYVEQTEGRIGGTKDISVKMKNDFDVRGFQFTMELPEGTTINGWTLNQGRMPAGTTMNKVFATEGIDENKINVVCALNDGEKTFTGNDGTIATVNVSFAEDMEEGTYPVYLTNNSISDATAEYQLELSDIKSTLVLEDYVVGDTNGDGKVLVGDVIAILNYIVGSPSNNFNAKAADVNGDGKILVGDVIAVLNIIVNQ